MKALRTAIACLVFALAFTALAPAADTVPVDGSSVRFPKSVDVQAGGKNITVKITGTALRTRAIFTVYAVASYVQDGVAVKSAEELAKVDSVKMIYIVMERTVSGADFLDAVKTAVLKGRQADAFTPEFAQLTAALSDKTAAKGEHVSLTYLPGAGLRVNMVGKADVTVKNPEFAQAVWGIFLGANPITESIKTGLVSLLGK